MRTDGTSQSSTHAFNLPDRGALAPPHVSCNHQGKTTFWMAPGFEEGTVPSAAQLAAPLASDSACAKNRYGSTGMQSCWPAGRELHPL